MFRFQGALAERQQLIPELVRNGEEENPLKVRRRRQCFEDRVCAWVSLWISAVFGYFDFFLKWGAVTVGGCAGNFCT